MKLKQSMRHENIFPVPYLSDTNMWRVHFCWGACLVRLLLYASHYWVFDILHPLDKIGSHYLMMMMMLMLLLHPNQKILSLIKPFLLTHNFLHLTGMGLSMIYGTNWITNKTHLELVLDAQAEGGRHVWDLNSWFYFHEGMS